MNREELLSLATAVKPSLERLDAFIVSLTVLNFSTAAKHLNDVSTTTALQLRDTCIDRIAAALAPPIAVAPTAPAAVAPVPSIGLDTESFTAALEAALDLKVNP